MVSLQVHRTGWPMSGVHVTKSCHVKISFFMIDVVTHERISPDLFLKSNQRPAKYFILTPQCAVWLRAMACTLWSLTQWCDAHCGVWPHRGMYIVHCTTMDFFKLLTTVLDREVWLCGRNPIIQRKFNRIRKYFSLFIRAKMFSKNDKIEVENLVTHSL